MKTFGKVSKKYFFAFTVLCLPGLFLASTHAQTPPSAPYQNPAPAPGGSPYPYQQYSKAPQGEPLEVMVSRNLKNKKPGGRLARGAGFYVDWDGHIITASHVVLGCKAFVVKDSFGGVTDAILIGTDTSRDMALLRASATTVNPFTVKDYFYSGIAEVNAVASMQSRGPSNVMRPSLTGQLNVGKFSVMRVVPALSTGHSGAPLIDDYGDVVGMVVGRWGEAGRAESIAIPGQQLVEFLGYHRISKIRQSRTGTNRFSKKPAAAWDEVRQSIVSVECKGV